jgi:hypothetical protein
MESATEHPACRDDPRLLRECDQTFTRRSGPGGQNRNKVETAVVLVHRPTGLSAEASERRTRGENRAAALFRLRLKLAGEIRSNRSGVSAPSALWSSRCRGGRIAINPEHGDFPALLAEVLDVLHQREDDLAAAAEFFRSSASQLVKLIKHEPRSFSALNERRRSRGLRPLF